MKRGFIDVWLTSTFAGESDEKSAVNVAKSHLLVATHPVKGVDVVLCDRPLCWLGGCHQFSLENVKGLESATGGASSTKGLRL